MNNDTQKNHLKAYGIVYFALQAELKAKWLLNYDGGAFLIENNTLIENECKIRGVSFEVLSDAETNSILNDISSPSQNQENKMDGSISCSLLCPTSGRSVRSQEHSF